VKLASGEPNDFIASSWFMASENVLKIFQVLGAGVIYNAEEAGNNFYSMHQNYKKK
jgi:hypothetical protein